jgi:hypothetical protein
MSLLHECLFQQVLLATKGWLMFRANEKNTSSEEYCVERLAALSPTTCFVNRHISLIVGRPMTFVIQQPR